MSSVRRNAFVFLSFLSLFVILYMCYSESHVTSLSVITTVHNSYIYTAASLPGGAVHVNNELRQKASTLETWIDRYPSRSIVKISSERSPKVSSNSSVIQPALKSKLTLNWERNAHVGSVSKSDWTQSPTPIGFTSTAIESINEAFNEDSTSVADLITTTESGRHRSSTNGSRKFDNHKSSSENIQRKRSDVDHLVESRLLKALMNRSSDNHSIVEVLPLEPQVSEVMAEQGCQKTGEFTSQESSEAWLQFKHTLEKYAIFHREQLKQLKSGNRSVKTLTWSCFNPVRCAGIGDQLFRIQEALVFAIAFQRVLTLHWNPSSYETMKYLRPNKIDWTYFNTSLGMHDFHDTEISRIKIMDTANEFEPLYNLLAGKNHTHVTLNYELLVPFLRGMAHALRANTGIREALKDTGFATLVLDRKKRVPVNFLSGKLLRYLFNFNSLIVDKVNKIQSSFGVDEKPYLAVHIRTGFLGMKQEESGKFNAEKIYRNPGDWNKTLACSLSLAERLFGPETPIYLATDSSRVKALAEETYSKKFVMINVTLQHVALSNYQQKPTTSKGTSRETRSTYSMSGLRPEAFLNDGVDGYMATWVEFLLLARASAMVHSISGFSSTASQFCSMHNQYHVPNCK